jgi:hypothetical protein
MSRNRGWRSAADVSGATLLGGSTNFRWNSRPKVSSVGIRVVVGDVDIDLQELRRGLAVRATTDFFGMTRVAHHDF